MAQETKSVPPADGTLRDILTVIEKKIRNLEKRKGRLELVEKELEMGKEVSKNQREALSKKELVLDLLEVCRDFLTQGEQFVQNDDVLAEQKAKKDLRELHNRNVETLEQVLRLQFLMEQGLQREEIEDNEILEALKVAAAEARQKSFKMGARFWMNVLEAKPKELVPGITYKAVNQKLNSIGEFLEKLNALSIAMGDQEDSTRGDSPATSSVPPSESELANESSTVKSSAQSSEEPAPSPVTPLEDATPPNVIEAELPVSNHVPQQPQHPTVAPLDTIHPSPPVVTVIHGVGVIPVSPVQHEEESIQFGSVEPVLHPHHQHVLHHHALAAMQPPTAENPNERFEDREFDFIQDDLTMSVSLHAAHQAGAIHMDPAVVCAGATMAPLNAHYQQILQLQAHPHPQVIQSLTTPVHQLHQPEPEHQAEATATDSTVQSQPVSTPPQQHREQGTGHRHNDEVKQRRSPQGNHRHDRGGDHEGGTKPYYRGMNGSKGGYGDGTQNGRGGWGNRGGNWNQRDRGDRGYGNGYGNGSLHPRNNSYGNRNGGGIPRREQTAQRV